MTSNEMFQLVQNSRFQQIIMKHPKRPVSSYALLGSIMVKIDGRWVTMVEYQDRATNQKYARTIDNFEKFEVVL